MAFRMNRPIIKGTALHKSSQSSRVNPSDLRKTPDTPFRQDKTGEQETTEQYNARVRAEYEAKLKAHSDSTAAYNQAVIIDDLYNEGQNIKNQSTQELFNTFDQERKNKEAYKRSAREAGDLRVQNTEISNKDTEEKLINPNLIQDRDGYFRDEYGRYYQETEETKKLLRENYQKQREKEEEFKKNRQKYVSEFKTNREIFVEGLEEGGKVIREGKTKEDELKKTGIYPTGKRKLKKTGENEYAYNSTAEQVKPGKAPVAPMEKLTSIGMREIKNIDMEGVAPVPVETKRKYMTSSDGKWKTNLETGEKTRVKTQKVKKFRKPGKRSVRNLVTGGTNRVQ